MEREIAKGFFSDDFFPLLLLLLDGQDVESAVERKMGCAGSIDTDSLSLSLSLSLVLAAILTLLCIAFGSGMI